MALPSAIGHGTLVGVRAEATYGTSAGDPTVWGLVMSVEPKVDKGIRPVPWLGTASLQAWHTQRDHVATMHDVDVVITGCVTYDDKLFPTFLQHALGGLTIDVSGPPYTHLFKGDSDGVVGLSMQVVRGDGLATMSERYLGLRVNRLEIEQVARTWMTYRATCIAQSASGMEALSGTPSIPTPEIVMAQHGSVWAWSGNSMVMRRWKLIIDNALVRRSQIGSEQTQAPVPGGYASVRVEGENSWVDHVMYADYLAKSQGDGTFSASGDVSSNALAITVHNFVLDTFDAPSDRPGELVQRWAGFGVADGTDQGVQVDLTNDNAAPVAT